MHVARVADSVPRRELPAVNRNPRAGGQQEPRGYGPPRHCPWRRREQRYERPRAPSRLIDTTRPALAAASSNRGSGFG